MQSSLRSFFVDKKSAGQSGGGGSNNNNNSRKRKSPEIQEKSDLSEKEETSHIDAEHEKAKPKEQKTFKRLRRLQKEEEDKSESRPSNAFAALMKGSKQEAKEKQTDKGDKDWEEEEEEEETEVVTEQGEKKTVQSSVLSAAKMANTSSYDPVKDATWKPGQPVPYMFVAKTFEKIEAISGRLEIIRLLTNMFRSIIALAPQDLLPALYLTINRIAPSYEGLELGIGESILLKAVADATGRNLQAVKADYKAQGDLGSVAQSSRSTQRTMFPAPPLTVRKVFDTLYKIAKSEGRASIERKKGLIQNLLVACKDCEATYIIRSLQGKLRIGLAEKSVQVALAHALVLTPPDGKCPPAVLDTSKTMSDTKLQQQLIQATETLKAVYSEMPNYDVLLPVLLKERDISAWPTHCHLTPSVPVHPMLAQPTRGVQEVLKRFQDSTFACEFKYDGERAQIHYLEGGQVHVYSRNLEDNTQKYPDIAQNLPKSIKAGTVSFILDCEVVAFDRKTMKILPFQVLSTRARKTVKLEDITVPVCLYAFDLLYLNGESLLRRPFQERRQLLHESFQEAPGLFQFARYLDTSDVEDIAAFLNEAIASNCEGLMVKTLLKDATYEPSRRSYNWLKVKKDYLDDGTTDSLDLVPIGAFYGKGKRTGVYGAYLLACYDDEGEEYQNICKIGTGFSDAMLEDLAKSFKDKIIPQPKSYYRYSEQVCPDVWFEPTTVWEVKAADLSLSPHYRAAIGLVSESKGISLRFPRFIRIREDKTPEMATTGTQVAEMYKSQGLNHAT
ncbi:tRNA ligase [Balamuthia mandrillaris]